ncbi:MAG: hypothetical protein JSS56_14295 [Proteobacteria bacterium]|nr:hypothetical protein [Pseudomonadota bacterium]
MAARIASASGASGVSPISAHALVRQVAKDLGFYGVFAANGDDWRRQRAIVMAGLNPAHHKTFLPAIADVTKRLRARWLVAARDHRDIDLLSDLVRYTLDATTCLASDTT